MTPAATDGDAIVAVSARVRELRAQYPDRFLGLRLPGGFRPEALLTERARGGVIASYERPDHGLALVAVGEAGRTDLSPGAGPVALRPDVTRLLAPEVISDDPALRPRLLGGFAFRQDRPPGEPWGGFGCGSLVLPQLLFVRDGDSSGIVIAPDHEDPSESEPTERIAELLTLAVAPASPQPSAAPLSVLRDVDRERWQHSVSAIALEVRDGLYEKAVLATSRELGGDGVIDTGATMATLRRNYPHCHLFTLSVDGSTFLGASPELLVGLNGSDVMALGLAGSAGRGTTDQEDGRLGRALLESAKDRIEHETVVRAIREALTGATSVLRAPNQPGLRRLRNIQHLATEISGTTLPGIDVLELVERLHPTPAVCGWPTDAARKVIAAHEHMDRGWYAGPIGWIDAAGDGEFAVALRAALVRGTQAWMFAGNGIMGDSDPASELAEVDLKFSPLAEALAGTPD
ncbi:MAG: isochorismate synthase [Dehalococcoidia bacterium]|nr:isochorismate synthase [Dehalococcoidia bacterium]